MSREAIDREAAIRLHQVSNVLWEFEFAECISHLKTRDYGAIMTLLAEKIRQETNSFTADVINYDELCWLSWSFRRNVRRVRKRYEAVSNAYGIWSLFMTRVEIAAWG